MLSRIRNYGLNRIQSQSLRRDAEGFLRHRGKMAAQALKPKKLSRADLLAAFHGRYDDDGRARFVAAVREEGLNKYALAALLERHRREFMTSLGLAAVCATLAVGFILSGGAAVRYIGAVIFMIFMFGFAIKAFGADFAAFQIRKRRFCGLQTYFREGFFKSG